jgi:hypothetical protein
MTDRSSEDDFSSDTDGDNGSVSLIPIEILHVYDDDDEISTYRTKNDPSRPHQRTNVTQRKGVIDIRCIAKDVVHGRLHPDSEPVTLLVFDFRFDPCKKGRRVLRVDLSFTFASENPAAAAALKVIGIAPDGRTLYAPTKQQVTTTRRAEINAGGAWVPGAVIGGSLKWEKTVNHEITDAAVIIGWIDDNDHHGDNGPPTVARWTLLENSSAATGVPASVRTAILLQRGDDNTEFYAKFEMLVRPDNFTAMGNLLVKTPKDDPIIYKPTLQATNRLQEYNVDRLGDLDLNSLCAIS